MLDGQRRLETAQGFRGPATRFFGPIENTAEATTVIREMCLGLLAIALVVAVASSKARALGILAGVVIAMPAAALDLSRNRIAAVALLVSVFLLSSALLMFGSIRGLGAFFIWFACVFMAGRASRATFKLWQYSTGGSGAAPIADNKNGA